jgi:hypothetical protein
VDWLSFQGVGTTVEKGSLLEAEKTHEEGGGTMKSTTFKFVRSVLRTMQKTQWKVFSNKELRTNPDSTHLRPQCPIAYVASVATGREYETGQWREAASAIGMDDLTRDMIVAAADGENINFRHHRFKGKPGQRLRAVMKKVVKV